MATNQPRVIVAAEDIRSGKNTSGSDMAAYVMVKATASPTVDDEVDLETSTTGVWLGVTMDAIADDDYGNIQTGGRAICTAGAAVAVGVRVMTTAAGKVITATANTSTVGIAMTAAAADTDLIEVELSAPGGVEVQV